MMMFVYIGFSFAQHTQNIRGITVDDETGLPLPGANITIPETTPLLGAMSDDKGEFLISTVQVGRHTIVVSFTGYQSVTLSNVEVETGKEAMLIVPMSESVIETESVEITAKGSGQVGNEMATVSARTFSVDDTEPPFGRASRSVGL